MWAHAVAQPNIALVKYWGKRNTEKNLPAAGSLSVTLDTLWTKMSVEFPVTAAADTLSVNGFGNTAMLARVSACLDRMLGSSRPRAAISSESNFPIAAGLASSSSAFAALVMAVSQAAKLRHDTLALARLAGSASGSAARSFYEGIVELRADDEEIDLDSIAAVDEWPLCVIVAVTEERPKAVGSAEAMIRSAATSPFYRSWVERQDADLDVARTAVREQDFDKLAAVSEHNCLKMHSVMWTSKPPIVYWNEATLNGMEAIRKLQRSAVPVFFTIDAGPQVKAVCLPEAAAAVSAVLSGTPGVKKVIASGLGKGARLLRDSLDDDA
ncbi:MAG: diphosphomevalonate decarboxylase [Woeseia sp.]